MRERFSALCAGCTNLNTKSSDLFLAALIMIAWRTDFNIKSSTAHHKIIHLLKNSFLNSLMQTSIILIPETPLTNIPDEALQSAVQQYAENFKTSLPLANFERSLESNTRNRWTGPWHKLVWVNAVVVITYSGSFCGAIQSVNKHLILSNRWNFWRLQNKLLTSGHFSQGFKWVCLNEGRVTVLMDFTTGHSITCRKSAVRPPYQNWSNMLIRLRTVG